MTAVSFFERQNSPDGLLAARAFRRRYRVARRWRSARIGVGVAIGTAGVLVALFWRSSSDYVSAAAALWLVVGRTILASYEQTERRRGVIAQECFDTHAFCLPWNQAVAGSHPAREDLRDWGRAQTDKGLQDWYSDARPARYPIDILICQRATIIWARQDHSKYAHGLRWAVGFAVVATLVLGVALQMTLGDYLLRLGLPVLPAALDVLEVADANARVGTLRARLEEQANAAIARASSSGVPPTVGECRQLQDGILETRSVPGIPNWLYALTRDRHQLNMEDSVASQVGQLPPSLR